MYAIMVPMDGDMLYVTEGDSKFHLRVKLFETYEEAQKHADIWGAHAIVVEYHRKNSLL